MNPFVLLEWQLGNPQLPVIVWGSYATYEAALAALAAEQWSSRFTVAQVLGNGTNNPVAPLVPQNIAAGAVVVVKIGTGLSNIPALVYGVFTASGGQTAIQQAISWIAGLPYGANCIACTVQF
jgi:hypothetical protein